MNKVHQEIPEDSSLILEKADLIEKLTSRIRRQVLQAISLQKKIDILLEELKRLEVSIKTQSKEINLKIQDLKESSVIFTEAVDPSSDDWKLQYQLRKSEEQILEMEELFENYFERSFKEISRKSLS